MLPMIVHDAAFAGAVIARHQGSVEYSGAAAQILLLLQPPPPEPAAAVKVFLRQEQRFTYNIHHWTQLLEEYETHNTWLGRQVEFYLRFTENAIRQYRRMTLENNLRWEIRSTALQVTHKALGSPLSISNQGGPVPEPRESLLRRYYTAAHLFYPAGEAPRAAEPLGEGPGQPLAALPAPLEAPAAPRPGPAEITFREEAPSAPAPGALPPEQKTVLERFFLELERRKEREREILHQRVRRIQTLPGAPGADGLRLLHRERERESRLSQSLLQRERTDYRTEQAPPEDEGQKAPPLPQAAPPAELVTLAGERRDQPAAPAEEKPSRIPRPRLAPPQQAEAQRPPAAPIEILRREETAHLHTSHSERVPPAFDAAPILYQSQAQREGAAVSSTGVYRPPKQEPAPSWESQIHRIHARSIWALHNPAERDEAAAGRAGEQVLEAGRVHRTFEILRSASEMRSGPPSERAPTAPAAGVERSSIPARAARQLLGVPPGRPGKREGGVQATEPPAAPILYKAEPAAPEPHGAEQPADIEFIRKQQVVEETTHTTKVHHQKETVFRRGETNVVEPGAARLQADTDSVERLADQVYRRLVQRINTERQRRGG